MTTTTVKVGQSLTIGFKFTGYDESRINDLSIYIGGVLVGSIGTETLPKVGDYYTVTQSSSQTSLMRGYRDVIVVLQDSSLGVVKTVSAGIYFDRLADEFVSDDINNGYNMQVELMVDETITTTDVQLLNAIKGVDVISFEIKPSPATFSTKPLKF